MGIWKKDDSEKAYNRKWNIVCGLGIVILALIPILLNYFVINNDYVSKASNDGWVSFFGGYIGGIFDIKNIT